MSPTPPIASAPMLSPTWPRISVGAVPTRTGPRARSVIHPATAHRRCCVCPRTPTRAASAVRRTRAGFSVEVPPRTSTGITADRLTPSAAAALPRRPSTVPAEGGPGIALLHRRTRPARAAAPVSDNRRDRRRSSGVVRPSGRGQRANQSVDAASPRRLLGAVFDRLQEPAALGGTAAREGAVQARGVEGDLDVGGHRHVVGVGRSQPARHDVACPGTEPALQGGADVHERARYDVGLVDPEVDLHRVEMALYATGGRRDDSVVKQVVEVHNGVGVAAPREQLERPVELDPPALAARRRAGLAGARANGRSRLEFVHLFTCSTGQP